MSGHGRSRGGLCWECGKSDLPLTPKGWLARYHLECQREMQRRREREKYWANRDVVRRRQRAKNMGMTPAQLDALYAKYDSRCGVCGVHESEVPSKYAKLHIDHDHTCCPGAGKSCGKCVRGLLCPRCNSLLTLTDEVTLGAIENYLEAK